MATGSQQRTNREQENHQSKYRGVRRMGKRWQAYLCFQGKQKTLGSHDTEIKAAKAYNRGAILYFKEFAFLNVITEEG